MAPRRKKVAPSEEEAINNHSTNSQATKQETTPVEVTPNAVSPKKKPHKYKLDFEKSPFPDHPLPTPEAAEEVHRILSKKHGLFKAPAKVPPPSATRTGCGEVPDLLDALLRTTMSANTSFDNSDRALKGLIDTFGAVDGSPDWHAISKVKAEDITKAIHHGGLSVVKGKRIKELLTIVRNQNIERREGLLKEKATGKPSNILATEHLTQVQKDAEIVRIEENPLTMDWVFEIQKDSDVIDELVKLPGIGVKTASCCLLFNLQRPSFAVDTHVHRHCKWLGWVPPNATADQTFNHCDLRIPNHLKYGLHKLFIRHGKGCYKCRANTNPGSKDWEAAEECPIEHLVDREVTRKPRKKRKFDDSEEGDGDEVIKTKTEESSEVEDAKPLKKTKAKPTAAKKAKSKATTIASRPKRVSAAKTTAIKEELSSESEEEEISEYDE
jgi:endonuclease III